MPAWMRPTRSTGVTSTAGSGFTRRREAAKIFCLVALESDILNLESV
jgi:hypothetical protein